MHLANEAFWQYVNHTYPEYLDENILEVGSYDINGSVKEICSSTCKQYVGVDWRPGPKVDLVCLAHDMKFENQFKAVLSASMLEHDPYYDGSVRTMCQLVRSDGILALSWGASRNPSHCIIEAPDGKFHPLAVGRVVKILKEQGFGIQILVYDEHIHNLPNVSYKCPKGMGLGEINLIAFPSEKLPSKTTWIDDLLPEDE